MLNTYIKNAKYEIVQIFSFYWRHSPQNWFKQTLLLV